LDPEETKEPLLEILKTKSTQRKMIAAFYGIEEGKIHTLPGSLQFCDEIHTEKVNIRPCRRIDRMKPCRMPVLGV
jgi:hypothetical protein